MPENTIVSLAKAQLAKDREFFERKADYRQYLETATWKARRAVALKAAKHRCEVCNSPDRLEVHHRTYRRLGEERDADLIVLCHGCHELFHRHRGLA